MDDRAGATAAGDRSMLPQRQRGSLRIGLRPAFFRRSDTPVWRDPQQVEAWRHRLTANVKRDYTHAYTNYSEDIRNAARSSADADEPARRDVG